MHVAHRVRTFRFRISSKVRVNMIEQRRLPHPLMHPLGWREVLIAQAVRTVACDY
jgi:hypothetical protein